MTLKMTISAIGRAGLLGLTALTGMSSAAAGMRALETPVPAGTMVRPPPPDWSQWRGRQDRKDAIPPWTFGDAHCSATLIAPSVLLTSQRCVRGSATDRVRMKQLLTGKVFEGEVRRRPSGKDAVARSDVSSLAPALILLSERVPEVTVEFADPGWRSPWRDKQSTVPIPGYRLERNLLSDPSLSPDPSVPYDRTQGTRLSAVSGNARSRPIYPGIGYRFVAYAQAMHGRTPWSEEAALAGPSWDGPDLKAPLVYRSVARLRLQEPERFTSGLKAEREEDALCTAGALTT